jgi:PKD repeat protein
MLFAGACDKVALLAPTESTVNLTISTTTLAVNGTAQVIATVIEQAGTPVQNGTLVTFTGSLGSFDPPEAITQNGRALTTFRAGSQSGTAMIGAVSGAARAEEVEVKIGGAAAEQVVVRSDPTSVPVTGGTTQVIAVVTDANGNPLPGAPVVFSADNGTLSSNSVITDANGEARVTLTTSRETIVTAAVGSKNGQTTVRAVTLPNVTIALSGTAQPEAGIATTFTVTPSTAATGNPLRDVVIDFGDGTQDNLGAISSATQVSHTYARSGQYRVTATATDVQGLTSSSSLPIQVNERSSLSVTMTAFPNPVSVSNVLQQGLVEFSATATGATGIQFYQWDFGDGGGAVTTGGSTNHRYTTPGNYIASVTVRASNSQEGYSERTVRVNP